jgi:hypothetical protein
MVSPTLMMVTVQFLKSNLSRRAMESLLTTRIRRRRISQRDLLPTQED